MSDAYADRKPPLQAAAEAIAQGSLTWQDEPAARRSDSEPIRLQSLQHGLHLRGLPRWTRLILSLAPRLSHGSLTIPLTDGPSVAACGSAPRPVCPPQT